VDGTYETRHESNYSQVRVGHGVSVSFYLGSLVSSLRGHGMVAPETKVSVSSWLAVARR
jgi:hypothetical protein